MIDPAIASTGASSTSLGTILLAGIAIVALTARVALPLTRRGGLTRPTDPGAETVERVLLAHLREAGPGGARDLDELRRQTGFSSAAIRRSMTALQKRGLAVGERQLTITERYLRSRAVYRITDPDLGRLRSAARGEPGAAESGDTAPRR